MLSSEAFAAVGPAPACRLTLSVLVSTQRQHASQCYPPVSTLAACRWRDAERFTFEHAAERVLLNTSRLSGGEVSTLMWSFATARHVHPGTFCRSRAPWRLLGA